MMKLIIDRGNTALKWQVLKSGVLHEQGQALNTVPLTDVLQPLTGERFTSIYVSNVGSVDFCKQLSEWADEHLQLSPVFVESARTACGVTNAYDHPKQLGVDRWLAMIAAHKTYPGMLCVVDIGTALTMDFLDDDGLHLGGFIVPGVELMKTSLLGQTEKISLQDKPSNNQFGKNTSEAVFLGIEQMLQAFIEQKMVQTQVNYQQVISLILTGGYAKPLAAGLSIPYQLHTELVLDGLNMLGEQASS
ncbi:MAG: type III pantothenate kinase [Cycloclasticus sp.]|nr:type III pantothenate kinase [Cycloclasticus sp.]MBQ0790251.1 type III pantothenate kinase [Cycloclasticus sp.]